MNHDQCGGTVGTRVKKRNIASPSDAFYPHTMITKMMINVMVAMMMDHWQHHLHNWPDHRYHHLEHDYRHVHHRTNNCSDQNMYLNIEHIDPNVSATDVDQRSRGDPVAPSYICLTFLQWVFSNNDHTGDICLFEYWASRVGNRLCSKKRPSALLHSCALTITITITTTTITKITTTITNYNNNNIEHIDPNKSATDGDQSRGDPVARRCRAELKVQCLWKLGINIVSLRQNHHHRRNGPPLFEALLVCLTQNGSQPRHSPRPRCYNRKKKKTLCASATCCSWQFFVSKFAFLLLPTGYPLIKLGRLWPLLPPPN